MQAPCRNYATTMPTTTLPSPCRLHAGSMLALRILRTFGQPSTRRHCAGIISCTVQLHGAHSHADRSADSVQSTMPAWELWSLPYLGGGCYLGRENEVRILQNTVKHNGIFAFLKRGSYFGFEVEVRRQIPGRPKRDLIWGEILFGGAV